MRLRTVLVIVGAAAVVVGCSAPAPHGPDSAAGALRLGAPAAGGGSAPDNLSLKAPGTDGQSANVSVSGQIPRPPAVGATLGAPGPGPVQLALVNAYLGAVRGAPPACRLRAEVLAAIAQVESGSAAGQSLSGNRVVPGVYGPLLSGGRVAAVRDTDGGHLDGNAQWDRAVGPMQFTPSAWRVYGTDGDGDGKADPQNVYDSVVSASLFLCAGGRDLSQPTVLTEAIASYNPSGPYLLAVLDWIAYFDVHGLTAVGSVAVAPPTQGPGAPTRSDPATLTGAVVTKAVEMAAELPVAPPPPQLAAPVGQPGSRTPSTGRPTSSSTTPGTTTTTTTTPDPTTATPDPTTTTPDPTTTTPDPTTTTPDPTTTTPDPTTTTPDPTTTTPDPTTTTPDPTTTTPDPTTTTPDPTTTTSDPTPTTSDPTTTTDPEPTTTSSTSPEP